MIVLMSRSEEKLGEAFKHIDYEIDMLDSTFRLLTVGEETLGYKLNCIVLESFLIHVRSLTEFLYNESSQKPDDVLALHYFKLKEDWSSKFGEKPEILNEAQQRAHKLLAHISYKRDDLNTGWNYLEMYKTLKEKIDLFQNTYSKPKE